MLTRLSAICAGLLLLSMTATAQSTIAGKWEAQDHPAGAAGGHPVLLDLTVKAGTGTAAATVTGSVTVSANPASAITDGQFADNILTFKTAVEMNGGQATLLWQGELGGDKMTVVRMLGGRRMPTALVFRRAK